MLGISSNRLFLAEPIEGFSAEILNFKISSLAHYLLEFGALRIVLGVSGQAPYLVKFYSVTFRGTRSIPENLRDSRSAKCCIFPCKMRLSLQDGTSKVSEAAGARSRFYPRIMLGMSSNRLFVGGTN